MELSNYRVYQNCVHCGNSTLIGFFNSLYDAIDFVKSKAESPDVPKCFTYTIKFYYNGK